MAGDRKKLVWAPKAKQDLRDIWRYFANVASSEISDKLLRDIARASGRLADHALMGRPRDELVPGLRSILVHPHTIFYRVTDTSVEIVRVLHERRDFGAIFGEKRSQ
jgi:toxin ParE1/3/4